MSPATKTKQQTALEAVQADLDDAQREMAKAEAEYATVDAAIANGDPVDMEAYSSAAQRRIFYSGRVQGLLKRLLRETVAAKVKQGQELKAEHIKKTSEHAGSVLENFDYAVTALRSLWKSVAELNSRNETTAAIASDLALKGEETPRQLDAVIRGIKVVADDLPPVHLIFAAIERAVEGERLKSHEAEVVRSLVDGPRPKPSVVHNRLVEKAQSPAEPKGAEGNGEAGESK
jgi:hypothetical protein